MTRSKWSRVAVAALLLLTGLLAAVPGQALGAGGTSIATATPVVYGQQQFGNTATDQYLEDSCGFGTGGYRSYWSLNVQAGDLLTIDWEGTHGTELKLMPIGTTDFNLFQATPAVNQSLSSNNRNQAQYTVPQSGAMPLYFRVCEYFESAPGPYDFLVSAQHAIVTSLTPYPLIKSTTTLWGSARLADGTPVPDGLAFTLTATWPEGTAQYTAFSSGGVLGFPLALPETAQGKTVTFSLSRPADLLYLATKTADLTIKVARAKPAVVPPKPHKRHHRKCRRGFKKRQVHGKVKCVKTRRHHHKAVTHRLTELVSPGLKQKCLHAGLVKPKVVRPMTMSYAGIRPLTPGHWHYQGTAGRLHFNAMPGGCSPGVVRSIDGKIEMQLFNHPHTWANVAARNGISWQPGNEETNVPVFGGPNHAWPDYWFNECKRGHWLKVRTIIMPRVRDGVTHELLGKSSYVFPVRVHGSCAEAKKSKRLTANYQEEWGDSGSGSS